MRTCLAATILLVTLPHSLPAQEVASDSSHAAAAAELIEVLELESHLMSTFEATANPIAGMNPMSVQFAEVVSDFMKDVLTWDVVRPEYVRIYQATYSQAELRELIAFYETPLGQKTIAETPNLMREAGHALQRLYMPHSAELQRRLLAAMGGTGR